MIEGLFHPLTEIEISKRTGFSVVYLRKTLRLHARHVYRIEGDPPRFLCRRPDWQEIPPPDGAVWAVRATYCRCEVTAVCLGAVTEDGVPLPPGRPLCEGCRPYSRWRLCAENPTLKIFAEVSGIFPLETPQSGALHDIMPLLDALAANQCRLLLI